MLNLGTDPQTRRGKHETFVASIEGPEASKIVLSATDLSAEFQKRCLQQHLGEGQVGIHTLKRSLLIV